MPDFIGGSVILLIQAPLGDARHAAYVEGVYGSLNRVQSSMSAEADCAEWLRAYLLDGAHARREILHAALAVGFTEKRLRKARERLSVRSRRYGFGAGSAAWWSLPEGDSARVPAYAPCGHDDEPEGTYVGVPPARLRNPMPQIELIDLEFPYGNAYDQAAMANWACATCGSRRWWRARSGRTYCARCSPPRPPL